MSGFGGQPTGNHENPSVERRPVNRNQGLAAMKAQNVPPPNGIGEANPPELKAIDRDNPTGSLTPEPKVIMVDGVPSTYTITPAKDDPKWCKTFTVTPVGAKTPSFKSDICG